VSTATSARPAQPVVPAGPAVRRLQPLAHGAATAALPVPAMDPDGASGDDNNGDEEEEEEEEEMEESSASGSDADGDAGAPAAAATSGAGARKARKAVPRQEDDDDDNNMVVDGGTDQPLTERELAAHPLFRPVTVLVRRYPVRTLYLDDVLEGLPALRSSPAATRHVTTAFRRFETSVAIAECVASSLFVRPSHVHTLSLSTPLSFSRFLPFFFVCAWRWTDRGGGGALERRSVGRVVGG
jgi:hypothetical protein